MRRTSGSGAGGSGAASVTTAPAPVATLGSKGGASPFSLTGVQLKLKVGEGDDPAEHEANHVANHVASGSSGAQPTIQRLHQVQRKPRWADETQIAQRKEGGASDGALSVKKTPAGLDAAATHAITSKDAGTPLRAHVQEKLEARMGADLSAVRVHEGPAAQTSAASLDARAFTHQGDIFLGKDESQENLNLMAHEATHVVQQGAAAPSAPAASAAAVSAASGATPATAPIVDAVPAVAPAQVGATASGAAASPVAPTKADGSATPGKGPGEKAKGGAAPAGAAAHAVGGAAAAGGKETAKSAQSDPAFQTVVKNVKGTAAAQKTHEPVGAKVAAAHGAVKSFPNEVSSQADAKQAGVIDRQVPKPFDREAFTTALLKKIADTAPKTLAQADDFKSDNNLGSVKASLTSQVGEEKKESQKPIAEKMDATPDATGIEAKTDTPLPAVDAGTSPQVSAAGAAPKPASNEDISLDAGPKQVNQQMADADVTEDQLKDSNESEFQGALAEKKDLAKESVTAPKAYRAEEPKLLQTARADAQSVTTKDLGSIHGVRKSALGGVAGHQSEAQVEEEKRRAKIFADIEGMYQTTKTAVEARLKSLDAEVNAVFDDGASAAQAGFEDYVDVHMTAYKDERYDGALGKLKWGKDKLFGLPDAVNVFYSRAHDLYVEHMGKVIDKVAALVEAGLNEAKGLVSLGKTAIDSYVAGLPQAEQETGKKAAEGIKGKFESLEQSISDKQGELVDSLAKKYNDNLQKVNARIEEMKAANQGLVDSVIGAIKGVIQTIRQLKDMLLNVLSRAAAAIGSIIAHPIRFLGHLVDAGILGFNNFKDHIVDHLKEGFMQWLFGAVAATGIQLPKSFDLAGILSLVLQVLGLTYANIRARAVNILGEKVVKALETAAEIFKVLITKGPGGLWEYIKDQLGNLVDTVIDQIKSFIMEKVIIAGITWLIGLLNPASAFVKACKAIYDIIMFFVERGSQILDLVNAIIDSITAIASGNIASAAAFIEKSLARAIPVIIGFLASLLGVGGISEKIKEVIDKIRKPINDVIDWVINKAYGLAKAAGNLLGFGKKDEPVAKSHDPEHDLKVTAGLAAIDEEDQKRKKDDAISYEDAEAVAATVRKNHPVFKTLIVVDGEKTWDYEYSASPKGKKKSNIAKATGDNPTEGLAGTYSELQGTKGDKMTPDHEPQHALMSYVSDLTVPRLKNAKKPFAGTPVENYSHGKGICLNLFQDRHYETRTYGKSPAPAIDKIRGKLDDLPVDAPVEKVQSAVKGVVRSEMNADHDTVRDIYKAAKIPPKTKARVTRGIGQVKDLNKQWWK